MKKLFTKFLALVGLMLVGGSNCALAEDTYTFGIQRAITSNTLGDEQDLNPTVTGVTYARGSYDGLEPLTDKNRNIYHGSSTALTAPGGVKNYRTTKANAYDDAQYYDFSLTIASGYAIDIKSITGDVYVDGDNAAYRMKIYDGSGELLYECGDKGGSGTKSSAAFTKTVTFDENIPEEKLAKVTGVTGKVVVKMHVWNTAKTGKYIDIADFNVNISVYEQTQTQYSKPAFTLGAYNQAAGTYALTLDVQNDEDGTINYTIGDGEKVTGVASGTVINVVPNTTVTATVSGSSYEESDEQSTTISAAPKLNTPTNTVGAFTFETNTYSVTLGCDAGAHIWYRVAGGEWTSYNDAFEAAAGALVEAQAKQNNMTPSDVLSFNAPTAPIDGTSETPHADNTSYTDGMTFNAGSFTIPSTNSYIGGKVSSGKSSINNSIKMRISRNADPSGSQDGKYGFHILVNTGYVITGISMRMLDNYGTDKSNLKLTGVYVDNSMINSLDTEVQLPKATANTVAAADVSVNNISATQKIVFTFDKVDGTDNPNQAQIILSADALVPVYNANVTPDGFGTMYYEKELVCPAGTTAYTGTLNDNTLTLTELEDGVIPANTPAIIKGEGGLFTLGTRGAAAVNSDLKGTATAIATETVEGGTVCVLGYVDSQAGFYRYEGSTLGANKAYLVVAGQQMKGFNIVFADDNATDAGIVEAAPVKKAGKYATANGIVIVKDGVESNVAGMWK